MNCIMYKDLNFRNFGFSILEIIFFFFLVPEINTLVSELGANHKLCKGTLGMLTKLEKQMSLAVWRSI